ncbi:hypothetical protein [uncultured Helicobacter sp.]|uniref:hypothetical protein n=1 Tax=uncultured Helicobacter sp. TaxID=175537 RepID=UPI003752E84B
MNRKDFMKTAGIIGIAGYMVFAVIGTIAYVSFFANHSNSKKADSIISLNSVKQKVISLTQTMHKYYMDFKKMAICIIAI